MVKIIADSTCDLSKELIEKYDIDILPLYIHLGEQEYKDGEEVTPPDIFQWCEEQKKPPKTSAPSAEDVKKILEPYQQEEREVIIFTISSDFSSTYQVVNLMVEEMDYEEHAFVVDSKNLSTGIGLLVLHAAQMAQEGKDAKEIVSVVEALKPYVRASFVVDTLKYLHRGGRCSATAALAGGIFKVKPKIYVEHGKMDAGKKYRGTTEHVTMQYVEDMEKELKKARDEYVFLTHSGCSQEVVEQVRSYLEGLQHFKNIYIAEAGGVISSHCGPGTLGVMFVEKERNYGPYDGDFDLNQNGIMEEDEKAAEAAYIRHLAEKESESEDYEEDSQEDF